jgi:hypothetical protein
VLEVKTRLRGRNRLGEAMAADSAAKNPFINVSGPELVAMLGAYALVVVAMVLLGLANVRNETIYLQLAVIANVAITLMPVVLFRNFGWFHPLSILAITSFPALLRGFPAYVWGVEYHRALPEMTPRAITELFALSTMLTAVATLSTYAGFAMMRTSWAPQIRSNMSTRGLSRKVIIATAVAAFITIVFLLSRGGFAAHIIALGKGRKTVMGGAFYVLVPARLGAVACWLWLAKDPSIIKRPLFWVLATIAFSLESVLTFSRSAFVFKAAIAALIYMMRIGRVLYFRSAIGALIAIYLVIVAGDIRHGTFGGELTLGSARTESVDQTLERGWSDTFVRRTTSMNGTVAVLGRVPSHVDYLYGNSYLALIAMPFPRAFWPDKPSQIGGIVGLTFFGTNAGVPPGSIGEAYWNVVYAGVVLVHLLFGAFLRIVANALRQNADSPLALVLYATTIVDLSPTTPAMVNALTSIGTILLVAWGILGMRAWRGFTPVAQSSSPAGSH